jgi:dihydrofolate synthase/folylpolyglutamate synthase
VWLDCAHNPPAAESLTPWLRAQRAARPARPVVCVFGASQDKDVPGVLAALAPHVDELVWVSPQYARCARAEELAARFGHLYPSRPSPAVGATLDALKAAGAAGAAGGGERPLILVTGSCFLVGEARAHLLGLPYPEGDLHTTAR